MLNGLTANSEFDIVVAIPEPGEYMFLLAGLGAALARVRSRATASR